VTALPGSLLQRIAARLAPTATYERVLLPLIADLQFDHARARTVRERARARLRGLAAFWYLLATSVAWAVVLGPTSDEIEATRRRLMQAAWASSAIGLALLLDSARQLRDHGLGLGPVFLLPSLASVAIPLGVLFATALAGPVECRVQQRAVRRLAGAAGLLTFVLSGWLTPLANQEYRERIFQAVTKNAVRVPLDRGNRELTFGELSARTSELRASGRTRDVPPLQVEWHKKPALGALCFGLAFLGPLIAATGWRRLWRALAAFVFATGVTFAFRETGRVADAGRLDPAIAMWAPLVALALYILALRRAAARPAVTRRAATP
jgi:lipopolysaccharide export system permease LptF/LptG-like protein